MPIYEYICDDCRATTETIRPMADADAPMVCEHCGSDKTHRTLSVFMARSQTSNDNPPPTGGCGRCGDPRGSCGM